MFTHPWDRMDGHGCTSHGLWLNMDAWVYGWVWIGCVWVYMCMWMYVFVWMYGCAWVYWHPCIWAFIDILVYMGVCVYIYIYIHMTLSCTLEAVT